MAVFAADGELHAVDNRCPHLGFPLDRGSVKDGILTCHWHEARFELASGCTFDLWADDAVAYATELRGDDVWVATRPRHPRDAAYHRRRLRRGLELGVGLVQAKSLISLLGAGAGLAPILADVAAYATANVTSFGEGLVRLTCVARLAPRLSRDTLYLGMSYAVRQLAAEANAGPPRRPRDPLAAPASAAALGRWLRQWVRTRHRDAVERTLLTAAERLPPAALADLVYGAAADRLYANTGHLFERLQQGTGTVRPAARRRRQRQRRHRRQPVRPAGAAGADPGRGARRGGRNAVAPPGGDCRRGARRRGAAAGRAGRRDR